jgi:purine nucleosidase
MSPPPHPSDAQRKTKIFLDTDIGNDPDDAFAMTYLLNQPRADLVGLTSVGRESHQRAAIAAGFCKYFDQPGIPVAAGADYPLVDSPYWWDHKVNQYDVAQGLGVSAEDYPPNRAIDLMRKTIDDQPGEITLVTIGPLTNVALLLAAFPDTAKKLKGVISMGGTFEYDPQKPKTDCNIMLDGPAASIVMQWTETFGIPYRIVSVEVTAAGGTMSFKSDEAEALFAPEHMKPLGYCCRGWNNSRREKARGIGVHDPLTASLVFFPEMTRWERGRIIPHLYPRDLANCGYPFDKGEVTAALRFHPDPDGPHERATPIDRAAVHKHLTDVCHRLAFTPG